MVLHFLYFSFSAVKAESLVALHGAILSPKTSNALSLQTLQGGFSGLPHGQFFKVSFKSS